MKNIQLLARSTSNAANQTLNTIAPYLHWALMSTLAALAAILYFRIYFGVDFQDEAFYAAIPFSFILGNPPFTMEHAPQQITGLITLPFIWLYTHVTGDTTGLILALRHGYMVMAAATGFIVYKFVRHKWGRPTGLALGLFTAAFAPFGIPTLSYNTIGYCGLVAGLFLDRPTRGAIGIASGLAFTVGIFAYPTMVIPVAVYTLLRIIFLLKCPSQTRKYQFRRVLWLITGLSLGAALCIIILCYAGLDNVLATFANAKSDIHGGGVKKIASIFEDFSAYIVAITSSKFYIAGLLALLFAITRQKAQLIPWAMIFILLFLMRHAPHLDSLNWVTRVTLSGYPFVWAYILKVKLHNDEAPYEGFSKWLMSIVGGLAISYTSFNGFMNFPIAAFPAALITILVILDTIRGHEIFVPKKIIINGFLAFMALAFIKYQLYTVYSDGGPISELKSKIKSGPYAGLFTHKNKAKFLVELQDDLKTHINMHGKTILFYDNFPAGYLMTNLKPLTRAVWLPPQIDYPMIDRHNYVAYYQNREYRPDFVVEFFAMPFLPNRDHYYPGYNDPFRGFFPRIGYTTLKRTIHYAIHTKSNRQASLSSGK